MTKWIIGIVLVMLVAVVLDFLTCGIPHWWHKTLREKGWGYVKVWRRRAGFPY